MTTRQRIRTISTLRSARCVAAVLLLAMGASLSALWGKHSDNDAQPGTLAQVVRRLHSGDGADTCRAQVIDVNDLEASVPLLIESYNKCPNTKDLALLIRSRDPRVKRLLVRALGSDDANVRRHAIWALELPRAFLEAEAIPMLTAMAREAKDAEERNAAIRALANQIGSGLVPVIFEHDGSQTDVTMALSMLYLSRHDARALHANALRRGSDAPLARAVLLFQCLQYPTANVLRGLEQLVSGEVVPKYPYSPANLDQCRMEVARALDHPVDDTLLDLADRWDKRFKQLVREEYTFQLTGRSVESFGFPEDAPQLPISPRVNQGSHLSSDPASSRGK